MELTGGSAVCGAGEGGLDRHQLGGSFAANHGHGHHDELLCAVALARLGAVGQELGVTEAVEDLEQCRTVTRAAAAKDGVELDIEFLD